ncbi:MAG: WecB/TagA/CpsF family glycosyltransferase [Anaerolineales bacterium]|nr:WecB/TagA/CpsF family glycosyltransferase [Anaerolineales bacterium]
MRYCLLGIELDAFTLDEFCTVVSDAVRLGARRVIASQNLHGVYLCHHDPQLQKLHHKAYRIHIDGMALIFLARLFGFPVRGEHRITMLDMIPPLMTESARQNWQVFYLGGKEGVAADAARRLQQSYPGLQITTHHGYFNKTGEENGRVLELIRQFKPAILLVGLGMPLQERWILENLSQLEANVILTSGACFDYIAGEIPIPPRWMGRIGLEWAFRLASEPRRLWKRYLLEPWYILGLVIKAVIHK